MIARFISLFQRFTLKMVKPEQKQHKKQVFCKGCSCFGVKLSQSETGSNRCASEVFFFHLLNSVSIYLKKSRFRTGGK